MTEYEKGSGEPNRIKKKGPEDDKSEGVADNTHQQQQETVKFNREDIKFLLAMFVVSVGFTLRGGELPGAVWATFRGLGVCYFYGMGTTFLFIGVAKAMSRISNREFTYNRVQFLRWMFALAALFAVSQFFHEGYLIYTGQIAVK